MLILTIISLKTNEVCPELIENKEETTHLFCVFKWSMHRWQFLLFTLADAMIGETFVWLGLHAEINESYRGIFVEDESLI